MGQEGISQRSASHVCPGQLCLSPDLPELTPMKWGGRDVASGRGSSPSAEAQALLGLTKEKGWW